MLVHQRVYHITSMWVAATIFFPNVDHTWSTWLEKSANNKPNLTPDLQALVSKRRELRDQESYGRSVPSYSKSGQNGTSHSFKLFMSHGGWRNHNFGGHNIARPWPSDLVTAMAADPRVAGRLGDSKNPLLRSPRVFRGAEGSHEFPLPFRCIITCI